MSSNNHAPLWSVNGQKTAQGQYVQFKDYVLDDKITMPISVSSSGTGISNEKNNTYYDEQPTSYGYVNYIQSNGKSTTPSSIRLSTMGNKMSSLDSMNQDVEGPDISTLRPHLSAVRKIPSTMSEWRNLLGQYPLVVLYIWKQSCVPCTNSGRKFEEIARHYTMKYGLGNVLFVKDQIDAEEVQDETTPSYAHYRICEAVPFFMIYIQNKLFTTQTGFVKEELCEAIEKAGHICATEQQQQQQHAVQQRSIDPALSSISDIERHEENNVVFYTRKF